MIRTQRQLELKNSLATPPILGTGQLSMLSQFITQFSTNAPARMIGRPAAMVLTLIISGLFCESLPAQQKPAKQAEQSELKNEETYIRIRRNERRLAMALETSVKTYSESEMFPNAQVDLIGAVHLGDAEYYEKLNEIFPEYDVVLFEAVMPERAVEMGLRPGGQGSERRPSLSDEDEWNDAKIGFAAISVLQLSMKDMLGMEFQLSAVDYTPENFVHADMTAEEFEATMLARGESFSKMLLNEMGRSLSAQQQQNPLAMNLDLLFSAFAADRSWAMRRIAASQLVKAGAGDAFSGADGTSTIITERNRKCLEVLRKELENHRKIGIFYGAGHFADMGERMESEFGFKPTQEVWIPAWQLRVPAERN